jgi:hypothetical protein
MYRIKVNNNSFAFFSHNVFIHSTRFQKQMTIISLYSIMPTGPSNKSTARFLEPNMSGHNGCSSQTLWTKKITIIY